MILDAHTHIGMKAEPIPEGQFALLEGYKSAFDGELDHYGAKEDLLRGMRDYGVSKALLLPVATSVEVEEAARLNNFMAAMQDGSRLYAFASVNPVTADAVEELERAVKELRLRGLKLHPNLQRFRLSENRFWMLLESIKDLRIPIIIHSGYSPGMKESFFDPKEADDVVSSFQDLTFIFAHMARNEKESDFPTVQLEGNVLYETSLAPTKVIEAVIETFGAERIVYGSDFQYNLYPRQELEKVMALQLSAAERDGILWENMAKVLGLSTPKKEKGFLDKIPFFRP